MVVEREEAEGVTGELVGEGEAAEISDEGTKRGLMVQDMTMGPRLLHRVVSRRERRFGLKNWVLEYLGIVVLYLLAGLVGSFGFACIMLENAFHVDEFLLDMETT